MAGVIDEAEKMVLIFSGNANASQYVPGEFGWRRVMVRRLSPFEPRSSPRPMRCSTSWQVRSGWISSVRIPISRPAKRNCRLVCNYVMKELK
jgi:hypothetical protein